ncbi:MAG: T9SS type A sorting domain-containing protein [Ignavibacteriaceae bacterium]|nr:VCBS repeat-containing protein [Ignavibacteria bacterium]NNJ53270.1 T9SS type A sorting domain-containing protein [Ignavibacteriaceae bacterium]
MYLCKYYIITLAAIVINNVLIAQQVSLDDFRKIPGIEVNLRQDSTIEVFDKRTNYRYLKNIAEFPGKENQTEADLILELDTINFAYYEENYRTWGKIKAWNAYSANYIAIDSDRNKQFELYVYRFVNNLPGGDFTDAQIYEQSQDSIFNLIFDFTPDSLSMFFDVGDITGDGLLDIFCRDYYNALWFYEQNNPNNLINYFNFKYNPFPPQYQSNTPTFYDIDSDDTLEIIYFLFAGDGDSVWAYSNHVAKYNSAINNYELIYYHRPLPDFYTYGISTGDFDQDGKGNFGTGSIYGKFYIYEYVQGTQYFVELEDTLQTYNAYLTTFTDDMDGNGKPEIWIGGDFNSSTYGGVTRIYVFEASGPGNYERVFQIDIRGLFAFTTGKLRNCDLDYDGKKDLFLANGDFVFGIKNNGIGSYYFDFIKLLPLIDTTYSSQFIEAIDAADLDGDNTFEIVANHNLYFSNNTGAYYSVFHKRNKISGIEDNDNSLPDRFNLYNNYPNPFNPETKIKFVLPTESKVSIIIYNILGKEITDLISDTRKSGEYEINWDGTDNSGSRVPSGIYIITMKANPVNEIIDGFQKTIKAILLK